MFKLPYSALVAFFVFSTLLFSCKTVDTHFAPGTPTEIYFQRAQQASDLYDYQTSLKIYEELLARTDIDLSTRVQAQYEVAFLNYKMGNYAVARTDFQSIIFVYDDPKRTVELPIWVRILSKKVMAEIPEPKKK
jgi:outer membrane protein assembly factor BamD (BamD/ComL family)